SFILLFLLYLVHFLHKIFLLQIFPHLISCLISSSLHPGSEHLVQKLIFTLPVRFHILHSQRSLLRVSQSLLGLDREIVAKILPVKQSEGFHENSFISCFDRFTFIFQGSVQSLIQGIVQSYFCIFICPAFRKHLIIQLI